MFLDGGNVVLRPYVESDRAAIVAVLTDPVVMSLAWDEHEFSEEDAQRFIDQHIAPVTGLPGLDVLESRSANVPIGIAGYRTCNYLGPDYLEFGFIIGQGYHGRGYATSIGEKLILHALYCLGQPRILAACNPANKASAKVLRHKLNMQFADEVTTEKGLKRIVFFATPGWQPPIRPAALL